ncbi:MAG: hypothetical protein AAFV43_02315 [Planctomycetota bacterium]
MSPADRFLYAFSAAFVAVVALQLVVPILRRKSDVFTTWNLYLVGALIFSGLSGINATGHGHYLATYTFGDYQLYMLGAIGFHLSATLTYHFLRTPRRLAGRTLLAWPKLSGWVLVIITVGLTSVGALQRYPLPVPFIGQLLFQFGTVAPLLAFSCAFIAWYRDRSNPLLLTLMLGIGAFTVFMMLGVGSSRRYLAGALAVVPVSLYWIWLRYRSTPVTLCWIAAGVLIGLPVIKGYSAVRHTVRTEGGGSARAMALLREMPSRIVSGGSSEGFMGQDSVEAALMTIHMLNDNSDRLRVEPFFTAKFILANPIPRTFWPEKPVSLGIRLPEAAKLHKQGIQANLGVNVSGQCFYDGGLWIHLLYGLIWGAFLRYYDELLVRQAGNPLLIGGLVAMAPQIIGFPRGGLETMGLQVFLGFIAVVLTNLIAKLVFGVGERYPRTDHIDDYPSMRSQADLARWLQGYTAITTTAVRRYEEEEPAERLGAA